MSERSDREEVQRRMQQKRPAGLHKPNLAIVVEQNIKTLLEVRRQMELRRSLQDRIADRITAFFGSMTFVYLHVVWFTLWIVDNLGGFGLTIFDPFPFGLLTLIVSLEAIFLATFVLLSQNRQAEDIEQRAELDLQINLLSEHEITRILTLVDAIADHLGLDAGQDPEIDELKMDVKADAVLKEMEDRRKELHLDEDFKPR